MARRNGKSLEHALVFRLRDEGKEEQEIWDNVEGMKELDVPIEDKRIEVALSQYEAKKQSRKEGFRARIKQLKKHKVDWIQDNTNGLLKVKLYEENFNDCPNKRFYGCKNYFQVRVIKKSFQENSPLKSGESMDVLFSYCKNCGHITDWSEYMKV